MQVFVADNCGMALRGPCFCFCRFWFWSLESGVCVCVCPRLHAPFVLSMPMIPNSKPSFRRLLCPLWGCCSVLNVRTDQLYSNLPWPTSFSFSVSVLPGILWYLFLVCLIQPLNFSSTSFIPLAIVCFF